MQPTAEFHNLAAFSYPPYVVLPLAPLLWLPFELVRWVSVGLIGFCVTAAGWLWFRLTGGSRSLLTQAAVVLFSLGFYPSIVLVWLQQLSGLVLLYLVVAHLAAARRRYAVAGLLLALALIKPQTAALPAAGLLFWALWGRERWPLLRSFALAAGAQLVFSEWLLPGWLWHFQDALARYREFNEIFWLPSMIAGGSVAGGIVVTGALVTCLAWLWWQQRHQPAESVSFLRVAALGFAMTVAVVPDVALYNRTFLLIPLLTLAVAGLGHTRWRRVTTRFVACLVGASFVIVGTAAWLQRLLPDAARFLVPLDVVDRINIGLPLFLLPAMVATCFDKSACHRQEVSLGYE
jgi:hypothetical protein